MILDYFLSLDPMAFFRAMPGTAAQGIIWGIMALGVYITFRILDFPDLTVDGSLATGAAVAVMLIQGGMHPAAALLFSVLAGMAAGQSGDRPDTAESCSLFPVCDRREQLDFLRKTYCRLPCTGGSDLLALWHGNGRFHPGYGM